VHALQDAIKVEQQHPGRLELPQWDLVSQKKVRDAPINDVDLPAGGVKLDHPCEDQS